MKRGNKKQSKFKSNNTISNAPVAISKTVRLSKPKTSSRDGVTTITHREYVSPVLASTTTRIVSHTVNPGLSNFPWLSEIAVNYEQYEFVKLVYTFVSAAATSERGRVSLSYQYDPTADAPYSRVEHFSIIPNVEEAPWEDMVLPVKCTNGKRYVRVGELTTGTLNTYDYGKLNVMTAMNANSSSQLGEIFVEYTIKLHNPQFAQIGAGELSFNSSGTALYFGDAKPTVISGQTPISWVQYNLLQLNTAKPMLITLDFSGTGLALLSPTLVTTGSSSGTLSVKYNIISATGVSQVICFTVKRNEPGDRIQMTGTSTTLTGCIMYSGAYITE
jgi:hypothetical protein